MNYLHSFLIVITPNVLFSISNKPGLLSLLTVTVASVDSAALASLSAIIDCHPSSEKSRTAAFAFLFWSAAYLPRYVSNILIFFLVRSNFGLELVNRVSPGVVGVDGGDVELPPVTTLVLVSGDTVFDPVPAGNAAITLGWEGAVLFQLIAFL
jgi:hypothetical protein